MELLVAADDRTGAFETAAVLADYGTGPVDVTAWPAVPSTVGRVGVVDVGTRHLRPDEARSRAAALPTTGRSAHKIDSTLRGNWSDELAERSAARPVLLVPALPAFGRTCVDGLVLDNGHPVLDGPAGSDARRSITSSRPAEILQAAGVRHVAVAANLDALDSWLASPRGVCVADASTDGDIDAIVRRWATHDRVVLAGTSAVIGSAGRPCSASRTGIVPTGIDGPVLVVCGSLHPAARRQIEHAASVGLPVIADAGAAAVAAMTDSGCGVLTSEPPVGQVDATQAAAAADRLGALVTELRGRASIGALVIIGGDTAAAITGTAVVTVHGSLLPGTAWATTPDLDMPVITRAGGFGGPTALVELVQAARES